MAGHSPAATVAAVARNALSAAAMRATLEHVLTDAAFEQMIAVASHFTAGVRDVIASRGCRGRSRSLARGRVPVLPGAAADGRRVRGGR
jgi:glutamate-1-semialdehyde aminotransferase